MTLEKALQIARAELPDGGIQAIDHGQRLKALRWPHEPISSDLPHTDEFDLRRWLAELRSRHPAPEER